MARCGNNNNSGERSSEEDYLMENCQGNEGIRPPEMGQNTAIAEVLAELTAMREEAVNDRQQMHEIMERQTARDARMEHAQERLSNINVYTHHSQASAEAEADAEA